MPGPPRDWLLITISTPRSGESAEASALRVYVWRRLRRLGAHYLHQSVCVLPLLPETVAAAAALLERVRDRGGHGKVLTIRFVDAEQEHELVERFQRERSDEYHEVVERTGQFHEELAYERTRGRLTYPELEESDTDLARHRKWLAGITARDYFDAPGRAQAEAAVAACERALSEFEAGALAAEFELGEDQPRLDGFRTVERDG